MRKGIKIYPSAFILQLKKNPSIYKLVSRLFHFVINFYSILIIPLLYLEIFFFIMYNFKKIISNKKILLICNWSFGHQILGLEYSSRYYYPENISLIQILYPRNNPYLSRCYSNIHTFNFKTNFFKTKTKLHGDIQTYMLLITLKIIIHFNKKIEIIKHVQYDQELYQKINFQSHNPKFYNRIDDKIVDSRYNLSGLKYLINNKKFPTIKIPNELVKKIENKIKNYYPNFFDKPFVCLLLRKKRSLEYYDNMRDSGPEQNYCKSIKEFVRRGYQVVSTGEVDDKLFNNINGYYSFKNIDLDYYLLNLYFILNTKILICQHSGPVYLTNSINTKNILINTFPFFNGTLNNEDKVLFIKLKKNNNLIPTNEIFNNKEFKEVLYGKCLEEDGYELQNCSENEIYNAIFYDNFYNIHVDKNTMIGQYENKKICKHINTNLN